MQNSGLKEKSEAAACVHSQASLGSPVSVQMHTDSTRRQTLFNNSAWEEEVWTKSLSTGQWVTPKNHG